MLNLAEVARECQVSRKTVEGYLRLGALAYPDTDSHRAVYAPSRVHLERRLAANGLTVRPSVLASVQS